MDRAREQTEPARLLELDGLRGLAAFSVFVCHCVLIASPDPDNGWLDRTPLHALWDGAAAVDLFFVLSGFVLAAPFLANPEKRLNVASFAVRRLFRILPAYWVAVAGALLVRELFFEPGGFAVLNSWVGTFWRAPPERFLDHVLLLGWWNDGPKADPIFRANGAMLTVKPVIWSLAIELRVSLVYPLFILLLRRCRSPVSAVSLIPVAFLFGSIVQPFWALPLFVAGGVVAGFRAPIARGIAGLPLVGKLAIGAAAFVLYDIRYSLPGVELSDFGDHFVSGLGSTLLVVLALGSGKVFLRSAPVRFLGRVSYSFYLVHFPLLLAGSSVFAPVIAGRPLGWAAFAFVALALALLLSEISYRAVEAPTQAMGRRVAARLERAGASAAGFFSDGNGRRGHSTLVRSRRSLASVPDTGEQK
jgi:peptidoglycan/LPS O-acetylase OafA/YrhL